MKRFLYLNSLCSRILGFQPNTYTFSKALAESVVNDARNDIPAIIYRPAVGMTSILWTQSYIMTRMQFQVHVPLNATQNDF